MKGSERITNQTMVTLFNELYVETDWKLLVYITSEGGKPTVKRKILIFPHSGIYGIRILKKNYEKELAFPQFIDYLGRDIRPASIPDGLHAIRVKDISFTMI